MLFLKSATNCSVLTDWSLGHVDKRFDREPRGGEVEETYE